MSEHATGRWHTACRLGLAAALLLGVLAAGCGRRTAPPTDSKSLKEHADELKKQHQREIKNQ